MTRVKEFNYCLSNEQAHDVHAKDININLENKLLLNPFRNCDLKWSLSYMQWNKNYFLIFLIEERELLFSWQ